MEQALRDIKQGHQIHKPDLSLRGQNQIHQIINTKPGERYVRTKVHEVEATGVVKTKSAALACQKFHHQPAQESLMIISKQANKSQVWDCGSSLYDSFELNSFNRQLDSAIKASYRNNSMPHLLERRAAPQISEDLPVITTLTKHQTLPKKASKLSKSFKKIMKSFSRSSSSNLNNGTNSRFPKAVSGEKQQDSFYVYDGSKSVRVLSTIPEMQESHELGKLPQDAAPVVRRAASERFTAALVSVSCKSRY